MTYIIQQSLEGKVSVGEGYLSPQTKEIVPATVDQTVAPDSGYDCLSEVTVKAVPYEEAQNSAGGITVKIG